MITEQKIRNAARELNKIVSPQVDAEGIVESITEWIHKVLESVPPVIEPTDVFSPDTTQVLSELGNGEQVDTTQLVEEVLNEQDDSLYGQIKSATKLRELKDICNANDELKSLRGTLGKYIDIDHLRDKMYGILAVKKVEDTIEQKEELQISPLFHNACPKLKEEEYADLEKLILKDGRILNDILTWHGLIVDGHNRYEIAKKYNISYNTREIPFASEKDVVVWIKENAVSQRNLTDFARYELLKDVETLLKAEGKRRQSLAGKKIKSDKPPTDSRKELADKMNISPAQIAKIKEVDAKADPELKEKVREGTVKVGKALKELKKKEPKKKVVLTDKERLDVAAKELNKWVIKYSDDDLFDEYVKEILDIIIRMREALPF